MGEVTRVYKGILLLACLWMGVAYGQSQYTIEAIGPAEPTYTVDAYGISDSGWVVGQYQLAQGGVRGFRWRSGGPLVSLGEGTSASSVNDAGTVAGSVYYQSTWKAMRWTDAGGIEEIGHIQQSWANSTA